MRHNGYFDILIIKNNQLLLSHSVLKLISIQFYKSQSGFSIGYVTFLNPLQHHALFDLQGDPKLLFFFKWEEFSISEHFCIYKII